MIERLARYVRVPSLSKQESALADLVAGELAEAGLEVRRDGANVWVEIGDADRPRLLFNSHLDTVPPAPGWSADPWQPRIQAGRLTGLGANDAKGCIVALVEAALTLRSELRSGRPLGGTVILALTAEEEISGAGLATLIDTLRPIDAAVIGEPTGLTPMIAQRGLLIVRATARGAGGHPGNTTDPAANAICVAAEDIAALRRFDWGPAHPLLGAAHANVTMISGGVARNVVPTACEFWIDVRTTPLQPHGETFERMKSVLKSELHLHSQRLVPVETAADAPVAQAARRASGRTPAGSPTMSDMVFTAGIDAVKIGPGESARSHTADEFVLESELAAGATAYAALARDYFARMAAAQAAGGFA